MTSDRKKPGVAFWTIVITFMVLLESPVPPINRRSYGWFGECCGNDSTVA